MNNCWLYAGLLNSAGYGIVYERINGKNYQYRVHRIMYDKEIPQGLVLDHLCRNRQCINPEHLEPVTIGENLMRGQGLQAINRRKTHCKYGHKFTPENTYIRVNENNGRTCVICKVRRSKEYSIRRKLLVS